MPCLNEAGLIGQAASSLGFGPEIDARANTRLIVVDNGSTDGTLALLDVMARVATGPIEVFREAKRGYVPPRHRGVTEAARIASELGHAPETVLILQADADTIYKPNYVAAMNDASSARWGAILEGAISRPSDFGVEHPEYVRAERSVDEGVEPLDADDVDEVVLDDKVCGYRLSDYLLWGGLFEEQRVLAGLEARAAFLRRAHHLALFRYLAAYVCSVLRTDPPLSLSLSPDVLAAVDLMPERLTDDLAARPGRAMIDLLRLIDEHPEVIASSFSAD